MAPFEGPFFLLRVRAGCGRELGLYGNEETVLFALLCVSPYDASKVDAKCVDAIRLEQRRRT
jgi:hypothetical protein